MNETTQTRLCRDCKHCEVPLLWYTIGSKYEYAKCRSPVQRMNPVSGKPFYVFCQTHRGSISGLVCGVDGQYFEPKKSRWSWLKRLFCQN